MLDPRLYEGYARSGLVVAGVDRVAGPALCLSSLPWCARTFRGVIDEQYETMERFQMPLYYLRYDEGFGRLASIDHRRALVLLMSGLPGNIIDMKIADGLYDLYSHLIHLREAMPALYEGGFRSLNISNPDVYAYVRETSWQRCYVLINFSNAAQTVAARRIGRWIAGTKLVEGNGLLHRGEALLLDGYEARLYELRRGDEDAFAV